MQESVKLFSATDTAFLLLAAALVFFMQAGFGLVEAGFTRSKNAGGILLKKLLDFAVGTLVFGALGFSLMFGKGNGIIGSFDFLMGSETAKALGASISPIALVVFQTMFCATAATIVSGAMAERTKFLSYLLSGAVISAVIYPIAGHWIWGGGWLAVLGFHDFSGSAAVHVVGGAAALVGVKMLGPRIGKYDKTGRPKAILGHSIPLGALGVFILWFGWFGFTGGSAIIIPEGSVSASIGGIFFNTNLAAAASTVSALFITWARYKKPDISMILNASLAGLVAISAGCDAVSPLGALLTGLIAACITVFGIESLEKRLKMDDPVGAIVVHCFCGMAGSVLVGLFSLSGGLFYGGGIQLLGVQLLGVAAVTVFVAAAMFLVFSSLKKTVGLRVSAEEEMVGLDIEDHGLASAYADFMPAPSMGTILPTGMASETAVSHEVASMDDAVPVVLKSEKKASASDMKMTRVTIVTKQSKFDALKTAMESIGITGMTVTQVLGCGMQKGKPEYYRGVAMEFDLLPKIQVDIVICKVPLRTLIETVKKVLYTGHIGDGKIFVYDVENVIKVRTGEEGYAALQDVE